MRGGGEKKRRAVLQAGRKGIGLSSINFPGRKSMEVNLDMICEAVRRATRERPADRIVLWAGFGGGTGTGGVFPLMKKLTSEGYKVALGLAFTRLQGQANRSLCY